MTINIISKRDTSIRRCIQMRPYSRISLGRTSEDLDKTISKNLESFTKRVENEVPEYGKLFGVITNEFQNPEKDSVAKFIKLTVKPSMDGGNQVGRILKIDISAAESYNKISPKFLVGTKEQLLKYLKDPNTPGSIKKMIEEANKKLFKNI